MGTDKRIGLEENSRLDYELLVFSGVKHHFHDGMWVAHGGFVREIDIWAKIFRSVVVAAVLADDETAADEIPYKEPNVHFAPIARPLLTGGILGKVRLFFAMFKRLYHASQLIHSDTVIMARGPDGVGFLGYLLTRFNRHPRFAKYAGQWGRYKGEAVTYRIQRALYRSSAFGGPVIVNTDFDPAHPHIIPLLNASISRSEWEEAGERIRERKACSPPHLLLVGRLSPAKGVDVFLKAVRKLADGGDIIAVDIVGDGPERIKLEALASALQLEMVQFRGWLSRTELNEYYSNAYALVNCSRHQGLDKVIIEAMSFALPVVATNVSVVPSLLVPANCGLIVEPDSIDQLAQAIRIVLHDSKLASQMGQNGRIKATEMLIDDQEMRYRKFLNRHLKLYPPGIS